MDTTAGTCALGSILEPTWARAEAMGLPEPQLTFGSPQRPVQLCHGQVLLRGAAVQGSPGL